MWILSLLYNDVTTYRTLRLNSAMRVGRNHDYRKDPTCLYIPDLKVPKTYITIKVGKQSEDQNEPTPLAVTFESICTTDVNGTIFKLPKKDSEPFERSFSEHDLLFKVNANKSNSIKIQLRWIPIVALPFSKKIQFDGVVQQSPLPKAIADLQDLGVDIRITNDPFLATHYVALTGSRDYNFQIAVSRALPVVSSKWCEFLTNFSDDVDSWLFAVRPDFCMHDSEGIGIFPNEARKSLLKDKRVLILAGSDDSKPVRKLRDWLGCLSAREVKSVDIGELQNHKAELEGYVSDPDSVIFRVENDLPDELSTLGGITNTSDDLWKAVVDADPKKLKRPKSGLSDLFPSEKRSMEKEPTPISQRRKRRKLERIEDTNFFSFSPLSSNQPEPKCESQPANADSLTDYRDAVQSHTAQENEVGISGQNEIGGNDPSADIEQNESMSQESITITPENESQPRAVAGLSSQTENVRVDSKEPATEESKKAKIRIVPEVSLAEAFMAAKQKAAASVNQELGIGENIEQDLGKRLKIEEFELRPHVRAQSSESNGLYSSRKNFKNFRKVGPRQNNITRTFIELVDNGNAVYFTDSSSTKNVHEPERKEQNGQDIAGDFASEMDEVRGYQPEASQLFVGDASESEAENQEDNFQFSARQNNSRSASEMPNHCTNQMDVDSDSSDDSGSDGEVRFAFTRRS